LVLELESGAAGVLTCQTKHPNSLYNGGKCAKVALEAAKPQRPHGVSSRCTVCAHWHGGGGGAAGAGGGGGGGGFLREN